MDIVTTATTWVKLAKDTTDSVTTTIAILLTLTKLSQPFRENPSLRGYLENISNLLPKVRTLIEKSECWRATFKKIDDLLPRLKTADYNAKDIINQLAYEESRDTALNRTTTSELFSSSVDTVAKWFNGYSGKVKEVHDRLDKMYAELEQLCVVYRIPENPNKLIDRLETDSFVAAPQVYGREEVLNKVISLVEKETGVSRSRKRVREGRIDTPESSESSGVAERENLSVLAIVGAGGIGKTTLAQMVCGSRIINDHLKIIWICVSDNFDVVELTKKIINCAGNDDQKNKCVTTNLNVLKNILVNCLKSHKFLLVLDDVWSEEENDWNRFFAPLRGCKGSMVIVTTRSSKTAKIVGTINIDPITLVGLEEEIYWDFFKSCAFGGTNPEDYPELEKIGKEIVVKLKGSPLAAKTMGRLLESLDEQTWKNIRDNEIWQSEQNKDDILPVLQLSYQYLPSHLKKCFSFCSLFPEDYNFKETELMRFWISEGFIDPRLLPQAEIVANSYIHTLVTRYFFEQVPGRNKEYVMHDLMHDVARLITKDECLLIEKNKDFEGKISNNDIRHLSVFNSEFKLESFKKIAKYNKLHSLIIRTDGTCGINAIKSWCREFTNVCSLSVYKSNKIKRLPDNIGNLKHLRYLDVSHTGIEQLPDSFCELYKLEFLNMEGCKHFKFFPKFSNRLISIKLLILPDKKIGLFSEPNISLVGNIPNFAKAIQLDKLRITITEGDNNTVGALKLINGIYGELEINELQNVSNKSEAQEAELNKKELVSKLVLNFFEGSKLVLNWNHILERGSIEINESDKEVLEGLCPQPNLKTLHISRYRGKTFPNWLQNDYLTNIMSFGIYWSSITTVPCLPHCLTMLTIWNCSRLTDLENCLMPTNLPSLKDLEIRDCPNLTCSSEMVLPPSIQTLRLGSCGELEDRFFSILPNLTSLTVLGIYDFGHLTSISYHNVIRNLERLYIWRCRELQSIGGPEVFASLNCFNIIECPNLEGTRRGRIFKFQGRVSFN